MNHNGDDNEKPFSFENVDFFSGLTYLPLVSVENGHLKRMFFVWRTKAEVFEYDGVTHQKRMPCKTCNRISIVLAFFVLTSVLFQPGTRLPGGEIERLERLRVTFTAYGKR